eukprot:g5467.t1
MGGNTGGHQCQAQCNGRWTKEYIPKYERGAIFKGFVHNTPNAKHNTFAWYQDRYQAHDRDTVVNQTARAKRCRLWYDLLKGKVPLSTTKGGGSKTTSRQPPTKSTSKATARLLNLISTQGPWTMFVPTNKALSRISDKSWDKMANDRTLLLRFLKRHICVGAFHLPEILNSMNNISTIAHEEEMGRGERQLKWEHEEHLAAAGAHLDADEHESDESEHDVENYDNASTASGDEDSVSSDGWLDLQCLSSEPIIYTHPERALMDGYIEHCFEKHHEQENTRYRLPEHDGFLPPIASVGTDPDYDMVVQQRNAFENALAGLSGGTRGSLGDDGEPLPGGKIAHNAVSPYKMVADQSAEDVKYAMLEGKFRRYGRGTSELGTQFFSYPLLLTLFVFLIFSWSPHNRHLPYGINESTQGGVELRSLESPSERMPVYVSGSAEDQYFYGVERKVAVGSKNCAIVRSTRCWNGIVHEIDGVILK